MMKKNRSVLIIIFALFLQMVSLAIISKNAFAGKADKKDKESDKLLERIDFGNSYIMGQTVKSGAVYLLQRKQNEIKTMLKYRKNYREEILEGFHIQTLKPDTTSEKSILTKKVSHE